MAVRDKSQGFAFVYTNLAKILAERDQTPADSMTPVMPPSSSKTINFNKDAQIKTAPQKDEVRERSAAINQIKDNLDRLQNLHHKLHAMLADLNSITDKKKR